MSCERRPIGNHRAVHPWSVAASMECSSALIQRIEIDMRTGDAGVTQQLLQFLKWIANHAPVSGRARRLPGLPALRLLTDLLSDEHGQHIGRKNMPKRMRRDFQIDPARSAAGDAGPSKHGLPCSGCHRVTPFVQPERGRRAILGLCCPRRRRSDDESRSRKSGPICEAAFG